MADNVEKLKAEIQALKSELEQQRAEHERSAELFRSKLKKPIEDKQKLEEVVRDLQAQLKAQAHKMVETMEGANQIATAMKAVQRDLEITKNALSLCSKKHDEWMNRCIEMEKQRNALRDQLDKATVKPAKTKR